MIANPRLEKYNNPELLSETKEWLAHILGIDEPQVQEQELMDYLKDGTVLCKLVNAIWGPDTVKFKESKMAFVQMENICTFLNFIRIKGVPQDELFLTVDLYEKRDPYQVVLTLQALSRFIYQTFPEKNYAFIGPPIATKHERPKVPARPISMQTAKTGFAYGFIAGAAEGITLGGRRNITPQK